VALPSSAGRAGPSRALALTAVLWWVAGPGAAAGQATDPPPEGSPDALAAPPEPPPAYREPAPGGDRGEPEKPPPPPPPPPDGRVAQPQETAPTPAPPPTPKHDGFFARVVIALGYQTMETGDEGMSGFTFFGGAAAGFVPFENLAIHGGFYGMNLISGSYRGVSATLEGNDAAVVATAFAAGVTYFVMPLNVYLSANVGIGRAAFQVDGRTAQVTDVGVSAVAVVGKEWWINQSWGIGVGLELMYMNLGGPGVADVGGERWNLAGAGLGVSTTFN